jgi:hypothetical protein
MVDGGWWKMEDGRWKMEDGRWKMEDGRWKVWPPSTPFIPIMSFASPESGGGMPFFAYSVAKYGRLCQIEYSGAIFLP